MDIGDVKNNIGESTEENERLKKHFREKGVVEEYAKRIDEEDAKFHAEELQR